MFAVLIAVCVAALAVAALTLRSMMRDRKAQLERIARATRPMHGGRKIVGRWHDHPGE